MYGQSVPLDCLIFGGGAAGLFTLDACVSYGLNTLLLESNTLGAEQTIYSQGMILGNLTHAISKNQSASNNSIGAIPAIWRRYLAGEASPNLQNVTLRSEYCHVWRTDSPLSTLGWMGIPFNIRRHLQTLSEHERPAIFQGCSGRVARVNGQVIEPRSLLETLSHMHADKLLQTTVGGVETIGHDGSWIIRLLNPNTGEPLDLSPKIIVLTAGCGNQALRELFGLPSMVKKKKYHSIVLVRGALPVLNGYCIHGIRRRLLITTSTDYARRRVWQIYNNCTMQQVHKPQEELIQQTAATLHSILPSIKLDDMEFSTYQTIREEQQIQNLRNTKIAIREEGNVLTCNPTDLAFTPRLASEIMSRLTMHTNIRNESADQSGLRHAVASWPRPNVALPPWETDQPWTSLPSA